MRQIDGALWTFLKLSDPNFYCGEIESDIVTVENQI